MKLYNTLTRKIEEFKPINPLTVGMYTCGPTVYGPGHLGHARSYTSFDLLKRVFLYNGYKVKHILNITDVHDDMIKKANELGINIHQLAERYIPLFKQDLDDLNIIPADNYPRVTEHITEIIDMVKILIKKGYAYTEEDGSVYYNVSKFKEYGKLSGIKLDEAKTGTRVETDKYEKQDVADFALWKGAKKGEPFWQSPWGKGRPGWHIECSVMANKYLGETIDLHAGAMDLKFPHHENEIAQSEAANGKKFVNYWFHAGLLEVENRKMSKSLGNYVEIHEIKEKGFDPLALRYLFLTTHYRSKLNFTWRALESAQNALNRLRNHLVEVRDQKNKSSLSGKSKKINEFKKEFIKKVNDDLNIPEALALMWKVMKSNIPSEEKYNLAVNFDEIFGLRLAQVSGLKVQIPSEVKKLAKERESLRKMGKFKEADKIRLKIKDLGFQIEDTAHGSNLKKI